MSNGIINFIKQKEGFRPAAYADPAGIQTIGYGRTTGSFGPTTQGTEDAWLVNRVKSDRDYVKNYGEQHGYDWSNQQLDALTSFVYNLGRGGLRQLTDSGSRNNSEIAEKIPLYNKADGQTLPGLVTRRNEEAAMFSGEPGGVPQDTFRDAPRTVPHPQQSVPQSFGDTFASARAAHGGGGGTFTWNGKEYTTDYKEELNTGGMPMKDLNDPTNVDTVPAWLTEGEYVLNKEATALFGPMIEQMNQAGLQQRHAENVMVQQKNIGGWIKNLFGYDEEELDPLSQKATEGHQRKPTAAQMEAYYQAKANDPFGGYADYSQQDFIDEAEKINTPGADGIKSQEWYDANLIDFSNMPTEEVRKHAESGDVQAQNELVIRSASKQTGLPSPTDAGVAPIINTAPPKLPASERPYGGAPKGISGLSPEQLAAANAERKVGLDAFGNAGIPANPEAYAPPAPYVSPANPQAGVPLSSSLRPKTTEELIQEAQTGQALHEAEVEKEYQTSIINDPNSSIDDITAASEKITKIDTDNAKTLANIEKKRAEVAAYENLTTNQKKISDVAKTAGLDYKVVADRHAENAASNVKAIDKALESKDLTDSAREALEARKLDEEARIVEAKAVPHVSLPVPETKDLTSTKKDNVVTDNQGNSATVKTTANGNTEVKTNTGQSAIIDKTQKEGIEKFISGIAGDLGLGDLDIGSLVGQYMLGRLLGQGHRGAGAMVLNQIQADRKAKSDLAVAQAEAQGKAKPKLSASKETWEYNGQPIETRWDSNNNQTLGLVQGQWMPVDTSAQGWRKQESWQEGEAIGAEFSKDLTSSWEAMQSKKKPDDRTDADLEAVADELEVLYGDYTKDKSLDANEARRTRREFSNAGRDYLKDLNNPNTPTPTNVEAYVNKRLLPLRAEGISLNDVGDTSTENFGEIDQVFRGDAILDGRLDQVTYNAQWQEAIDLWKKVKKDKKLVKRLGTPPEGYSPFTWFVYQSLNNTEAAQHVLAQVNSEA